MKLVAPSDQPSNESERRNAERLRFALEAANDGLWDWDIPSRSMYLSPRCAAILGYAPSEHSFSFDTWETSLHPEDRDSTLGQLAEVVEGRAPTFTLEYRIRSKAGAWVWVSARGKVVAWHGSGKAARAVGTLTDITERKQTEQVLREREEQLRLALRSAEAGAWILVMAEDRLVWSEEMYRIYGVNPQRETPSNELWLARIHPEDRSRVEAMADEIFGQGQREYQVEFRIAHPQTGTRWLLARGQVEYDDSGEPARISGITIDNTERKLAEIALEDAKLQAEMANRSKSEFLATMSHELRTPLNAIIGFAELIMSEMFGPVGAACYRDYASDIHASGAHLLELINEILDLSKIEAGRFILSPELVDLDQLVESCVSLVRPRAEEGYLTLAAEIPRDVPMVWADELRLKQILLNLLSNAVKFTPAGGNVRVDARRVDDLVAVVITDTGIGMRPDEIGVALEPFRQLESPLSRRYEGTGLGLPIAKRLTEALGGQLVIESAEGAGTKVTVMLPGAPGSV